jgi:hypothetical protein
MDELEIIREFIAGSSFSPAVKEALNEFIAVEFKSGSQSDYLAIIKKNAEGVSNED